MIGLTAIGAALALVDPALADTTHPHPALTGSLGNALEILQNNGRVLAAPFLMATLEIQHTALGRRVGDTIILTLTAASTLSVGLELGRWRERLLPYIPQLPIEWTALAVSITAWLLIRTGEAKRAELVRLAILAAALTIAAASVETWCTPHRHTATESHTEADTAPEPHALMRAGGCFRSGFCAAQAVPLQGRTLPSPHAARFRWA